MADGNFREGGSEAIGKAKIVGPWLHEPTVTHNRLGDTFSDRWPSDNLVDHIVGIRSTYGRRFHELLQQEGFTDFQPLLEERKAGGQTTHVLDLFGSGNFIDDLSVADSITGVRLKDNTEEMLRELQREDDSSGMEPRWTSTINRLHEIMASPNWTLIEGNLYRFSTWIKLRKHQKAKNIPSFDIITVAPAAPFFNMFLLDSGEWASSTPPKAELKYGPTFLRLLARTYGVLSFNKGQLFAEVPEFVDESFIGMLQTVGQQEAAVKVDVSNQGGKKRYIKITKSTDSTPDIGGLIATRLPIR